MSGCRSTCSFVQPILPVHLMFMSQLNLGESIGDITFGYGGRDEQQGRNHMQNQKYFRANHGQEVLVLGAFRQNVHKLGVQ